MYSRLTIVLCLTLTSVIHSICVHVPPVRVACAAVQLKCWYDDVLNRARLPSRSILLSHMGAHVRGPDSTFNTRMLSFECVLYYVCANLSALCLYIVPIVLPLASNAKCICFDHTQYLLLTIEI
jgi:hypothetical protein